MSIGYHFVNAIFGSVKHFLSPRVLISGFEKFGHVKMIEILSINGQLRRESFSWKDRFQALQHCTPENKYLSFKYMTVNVNVNFDIPHPPFSSSIVLWGGGVAVSRNWDLIC